jgi:hypothetical protein
MPITRDTERSGILNETTMTLHKRETGTADPQTPCGHTYHVAHERLRIVEIETVTEDREVTRCGQCFDDAGGY